MPLQVDQVAEAFVAVPGVLITMLDANPSTGDSPSGSWTEIDNCSGTFAAAVAGLYSMSIDMDMYASGDSTAFFRVVIDEGTGSEIIIGGDADNDWLLQSDGPREFRTKHAEAELAAGSHTIAMQWKANTGSPGVSSSSHFVVVGLLASGSGAGGVIVATAGLTADETGLSGTSPSAVSALSNTFNSQDEQVELVFRGSAWLTANAPSAIEVHYRVDGGSWVFATFAGATLVSTAVNLSFDELVTVAEGPHTIDIGIAVQGTGVATLYEYTKAFVKVHRGGQVPWEVDGVLVSGTPRAINVDGATAALEDDGTGKLSISLPKAVTAQGDLILVSDGYPSVAIDVDDGTDHLVMPESGSLAFTALVSGTYAILFGGELSAQTSNVSGQFKLVFDEGEANEQTVGYTDSWTTRSTTGSYVEAVFKDEVVLSAGSHTVKAYAKRTLGTGALRVASSDVHPLNLSLQAVTGSGAGGNIVSEDVTTADNNIVATSLAALPTDPLSITFESADETILVGYSTQCSNNYGSATTIGLRMYLDGSPVGVHKATIIPTNTWPGEISDTLTLAVGAGSHTLELYASSGSTQTFQISTGARLWVKQDRGGLVPITDGTTTVDKPIAQHYVNAEVTDSGGKALITLPKAVTAQGVHLDVLQYVPTAANAVISTQYPTWSDITDGTNVCESTYNLPQAGDYYLTFSVGTTYNAGSGQSSCFFRVIIDEGEANEQVIEAPINQYQWKVVFEDATTNHFQEPTFRAGLVTLTAGSHTFKIQGAMNEAAESARLSQDWGGAKIDLQLVSGSGAGGTLVDSAVLSATAEITGTDASPAAISGLSVTVDCSVGEWLTLSFAGSVRSRATPGSAWLWFADGSTLLGEAAWAKESNDNGYLQDAGASIAFQATATSHTFNIYGGDNAGGDNWEVEAGFRFEVTQYRGGLVPFKNNGALVTSTPTAINAVGPGLVATNVDGQVNLSVESAAEGVSSSIEETTSTTVSGVVSPSWSPTLISDLTQTVEVAEGERVVVSFAGHCDMGTSGTASPIAYLFIDDEGSAAANAAFSAHATCFSQYEAQGLSFTYVTEPLTAGSHTFRLYATKYDSGHQNWNLTGRLQLTQFKGGYVTPMNVPVPAYNNASTFDLVARPGAQDRFWLTLSDGQHYYANGPTINVDLTANGYGGLDTGSEATDTWYYAYAVPGATSGQFGVVASATDPDSGGPTGYAAWKYLGAVYNNTSSNIRRFVVNGREVYFPDADDVALMPYYIQAWTPTVNTWFDTGTAAPSSPATPGGSGTTGELRGIQYAVPVAVASHVQISGQLDGDTGGIVFFAESGEVEYDLSNTQNQRRARTFLQVAGNTQQAGERWIPLYNNQIKFAYLNNTAVSTDLSVSVMAYRDEWMDAEAGAGAAINTGVTPLTTKGDLMVYSTDSVRLPVGTDGQIIEADSTEAKGLKWADKEDPVSENRVVGVEVFS